MLWRIETLETAGMFAFKCFLLVWKATVLPTVLPGNVVIGREGKVGSLIHIQIWRFVIVTFVAASLAVASISIVFTPSMSVVIFTRF